MLEFTLAGLGEKIQSISSRVAAASNPAAIVVTSFRAAFALPEAHQPAHDRAVGELEIPFD
jgi:hypothetical protein